MYMGKPQKTQDFVYTNGACQKSSGVYNITTQKQGEFIYTNDSKKAAPTEHRLI